jgi:hypothetical protein
MLFDVLRKNGVKFALKEVHKGALRQIGLRKRLPKHTQPFASFSKRPLDPDFMEYGPELLQV